jgi:Ankyrin repeats (3 copies)
MDGRLDLTRARREAKARLSAMRAHDPAAKLSDAQLAVARDWGERSWPALVRRAEAEAAARPTPLARAAGDAERTARLLEGGADPRDEEAVRRAAAAEDPASLRLLLAAGADPRRTQALATVLEREDPETVALLLDHLPEHSGERAWALLWAVQHGRSEEIVRLLVERGADLEAYDEANDRRPYGLAIRRGRPDLAELLASLGAQRRAGPVAELLGACFAGASAQAHRLAAERPEAVALLRGAYAGVLAEAAGEGRTRTVELLLELGVPANARAETGLTPLEAAQGDPEVTALLLAHGADPAKPGTPPAVAASPLDFAELSWQAEVAYLRLLAAAPQAESRPIGDGFAVRTGAQSNTENGVVCDRATAAEVAEAIAWLDGAPAQWFIGSASTLGPLLTAPAPLRSARPSCWAGRSSSRPPRRTGSRSCPPATSTASTAEQRCATASPSARPAGSSTATWPTRSSSR